MKIDAKVIIIALLVAALLFKTVEGFASSPRYMWRYNPTSKNSSYDTRGDPLAIKKDMTKTGVFWNSSLYKNHTNQRLHKDYINNLNF